MKAYKISTGDDPDKEPSPENGYKKAEKEISEKITTKIVNGLTEAIRNKGYTQNYVSAILKKYGYTKLEEIEAKNLANIKKDLEI